MNKASGAEQARLKNDDRKLMDEARTTENKLPELKLEYSRKAYESMKEAARQNLKPNVQALAGELGQGLARLLENAGQQAEADNLREEVKMYYRSILAYKPKLDEVRTEHRKQYPRAQEILIQLANETDKLRRGRSRAQTDGARKPG